MAVQTPQAAWFSELLKAHQRAEADGWVTTDDAAIMEMAGYKVSVVLSTRWNIKITTKEDLRICEALALAINR
jgi:2-C-methyl-D-erythritol 4-phosphate cytidylyltransferase